MNQKNDSLEKPKNMWNIATIAIAAVFIAMLLVVMIKPKQQKISTLRIDKSNTIYSPDRSVTVYLEKEYNTEIQRFTRQSVVLENLKTGTKKILNEIIVTKKDALERYTKDGCNEDKTVCCNSEIDFNEFKPIVWFTDDLVEVDQYFDNYECAGAVTETLAYDSKGETFFSPDLVKKFDYTTDGHTNDGWTIANICQDETKIAFILDKNMFGGYSYLEYSKSDNTLGNQMIEKNPQTEGFFDFIYSCYDDVLNINKVKKYFN